ncbi:ABC transporter ATP-binding protein [Actinokineospora pegani]|uniref:ABC transporter ATP-binding protein n=1 Tax=Actinokineospora pegani TaxID=2654637 RepID=UPI001F46302B|nr:ABC transporter ATP-binding protein [Actinokineospora pegani]
MSALLPVADRAGVRRAVAEDIRAERGLFAVMLVLTALAAAAGLVAPRLVGQIVDLVRTNPGPTVLSTVDLFAAVIVAAGLAQVLLTRQARYAAARFGERTAARVRERFAGRALDLPATTVDHTPTGDLVARGTTDVGSVTTALRDGMPEVFVNLVQVAFLYTALLTLDPLLGLVGMSGLVTYGLALRWYLRRARAAYLAEAGATAAVTEVLTATAGGARTVEALGLRESRLATVDSAIVAARRTRLGTLRLRSVLFPSIGVSHGVPLVIALVVGGALLSAGWTTLGAVVAAMLYLRQLGQPLDTIMLWVEQVQQAGAAYARVEGLAAVPAAPAPVAAVPTSDRIEVVGCRYAYGGGREVLRGIDLDIAPGERLAVVGPSGAGKSTLGRLLAGLDEPGAGRVTVGGVPVAALGPDRLRRQVVLVTQEHHVFRDSVRGNLALAAPDADDARMLTALGVVGAGWAVDLGLDARLTTVDGGQAQQLALARVVLADPHTVVLDEATALLDPTAARSTERALSAVLSGRTVIAIAHRLHTAHDADRIAVVVEGSIVELGPHDELLRRGGAYARLWKSWHG